MLEYRWTSINQNLLSNLLFRWWLYVHDQGTGKGVQGCATRFFASRWWTRNKWPRKTSSGVHIIATAVPSYWDAPHASLQQNLIMFKCKVMWLMGSGVESPFVGWSPEWSVSSSSEKYIQSLMKTVIYCLWGIYEVEKVGGRVEILRCEVNHVKLSHWTKFKVHMSWFFRLILRSLHRNTHFYSREIV
jgi:hypothetical protein